MYRSLEDLLFKGCQDLPHAAELDQVKKLYSDYLRPVSTSTSIYIEVMSILSTLRTHLNQTLSKSIVSKLIKFMTEFEKGPLWWEN